MRDILALKMFSKTSLKKLYENNRKTGDMQELIFLWLIHPLTLIMTEISQKDFVKIFSIVLRTLILYEAKLSIFQKSSNSEDTISKQNSKNVTILTAFDSMFIKEYIVYLT
jgi:hypothetical protein